MSLWENRSLGGMLQRRFFFSHILTEDPFGCLRCESGKVRKAVENLHIRFLWLFEGRMRAGSCFHGSFLEKGVLTGKCGRRRGKQTLNYRNMNFSTCGAKTNPAFQ